jgi:hypothetical protein
MDNRLFNLNNTNVYYLFSQGYYFSVGYLYCKKLNISQYIYEFLVPNNTMNFLNA